MVEEKDETTSNVDLLDTKITDWENEPSLRDLKQNYEDAKPTHDAQMDKIQVWQDNLRIQGKAKIRTAKGKSELVPKVIRKQAEWRYSSLSEPFLATDNVFNVYPTTGNDKARAYQNQLVLNNQLNTKIDKVAFIDEYVRAAVNEGTIIVRIGWLTEEAEVTKEVPVFSFTPDPSGQMMQKYTQLLQIKEQYPDSFKEMASPALVAGLQRLLETGEATVAELTHYKTITKLEEVKNQPTLEILNSANVTLDPTCNGDISKANFVVYTYESSYSELKESGNYTNLDNIHIEGASPLAEPDHEVSGTDNTFTFSDKPRQKVVVYEYWGFYDIDGTGIVKPFVCSWVGNTIIRLERNPYPDQGLPFVFVPFMPLKKSAYGEPDGELLEDNQKVIGAVTRGMIDLMAGAANGQTGFMKNLLDATNKRKFQRGEDYEFNQVTDPRLGIYQHTYPEIPQSAYNMLNLQNAEAESLTGVKAFNNGITGDALGETAANGRSALDASSKRELGILRRLASGMIKVGRKIISMNAEFLSDEEVVRVTDKEFVSVRRDDLAGNYDLKLSISTPEEDHQKASELAFMLQTLGPNEDPAMRRMILSDIARLRRMPELADKLDAYEPQPDPMEQAKVKAELMLLQAQTQKELALARQHAADADLDAVKKISEQASAMLDWAKAGTEKAKARQLGSDADTQDLDYLEQESGVKQERDLQKIERQAESQAQTKIIEAGLKAMAGQSQQ